MAIIFRCLLLAALMFSTSLMAAGIETREFDDPVSEKRYRDLTASMRCPLCENQAIDDSDAPISGDMRERVYVLLQEGQSDIEIINHMVSRFGEYILYNPRLDSRTWLLWGIPIGLVVLGTGLVFVIIQRRRQSSAAALSEEERRRLASLINDRGAS